MGLAGLASGADIPGPIVVLPPVVVTDSMHLPKPEAWRYGRVADFEVLSNASDATTHRMVRDLLKFQQAVSVVWKGMQHQAPTRAHLPHPLREKGHVPGIRGRQRRHSPLPGR